MGKRAALHGCCRGSDSPPTPPSRMILCTKHCAPPGATQTLRHCVISLTTLPSSSAQVFAEVPSGKRGLLGTKGLPCDRGMEAVQSTHTAREGMELWRCHVTNLCQRPRIYRAFWLLAQHIFFLFLKPSDYSGHVHTYTHTHSHLHPYNQERSQWVKSLASPAYYSIPANSHNEYFMRDYKDCYSSILEGCLYRSLTLSSMNLIYILLQCILFNLRKF